MRNLADLAVGIGAMIALRVPIRDRRWTSAEMLDMFSRSFTSELEKAELKRLVLAAECAADRAEHAARRTAWTVVIGTLSGFLMAMGIWEWLT